MIERYAVVLISLVLAGLFNSEMDTIKFTPKKAWFQSEFWLRNLWQVGWFRKTFGFFTLDGWHLCKGAMIYCFLFPAAYLLCLNVYWSFLIDIPLMMLVGGIFELGYEY